MTTRELQATQKAVAKNLRRLARKLSTGSLEDAGEIRRAIRYDADALRGFGLRCKCEKLIASLLAACLIAGMQTTGVAAAGINRQHLAPVRSSVCHVANRRAGLLHIRPVISSVPYRGLRLAPVIGSIWGFAM